MTLVNLTAKKIIIFAKVPLVCLPSGIIAKVIQAPNITKVKHMGLIPSNGSMIKLRITKEDVVTDLPDHKEGVLLIVNVPVRNARRQRGDLVSPVDLVWDNGEVIGCREVEMNASPWMK